VPLCEVFLGGISQGFHNELTVRNLLLAVKDGEIESTSLSFCFNGITSKIQGLKIVPQMRGFLDKSSELAYLLIN
jgi:hypothetical protein